MGSLGETLAEERRRRGRTIADVEAATRIRGRLLEALENGRYEELPSPAYVKGYIQSYAQYLELPVRTLLEQYAAERRLTPESHPEERGLPDLPADPVVPHRAEAQEMPIRTWATIVSVLILGALVVWGIVALVHKPATNVPAAPLTSVDTTTTPTAKPKTKTPKTTTPAAEESATASSEASSAAKSSDSSAKDDKSSDKPFTLRVSVADGEASWIRVTVDGLKAYEGTLEGGMTKEWNVSDEAHLRVGRPSAVTVTRDGKEVPIDDTGNIGVVDLTTASN